MSQRSQMYSLFCPKTKHDDTIVKGTGVIGVILGRNVLYIIMTVTRCAKTVMRDKT